MIDTRERRGEWIDGYEAPIKRALWERVTSFGAPRVWASLWIAVCLYAGLFALVGLGFKWVALPAIVWLLGHGVLIGLTLWDPNWDEVASAQLTNRYKDFYDAG
jgi:type IV secretory pathway TrbD component